MIMDIAARAALFVKPAVPSIWSAMMIYQLGYINVSKILKPGKQLAVAAARVTKAAFGLFLIWLFLKQFIFVDVNMHRFADSAWLPLIEVLFR